VNPGEQVSQKKSSNSVRVAVALTALVFCFSMTVRDGAHLLLPMSVSDIRERIIIWSEAWKSGRAYRWRGRRCGNRIGLLNQRIEPVQITGLTR